MRYDTVVVLLAAGRSKRTTDLKQLYKTDDDYLINLQIKKLQNYGYDVVLVLGHEYAKISSVVKYNVNILNNKDYINGMFSSVKYALKNIEAKRYIFCHLDRPIASKELFEKHIKSKSEISVSLCDEKKAPPIKILSSKKRDLLSSGEERLDHYIASQKVEYIETTEKTIHFNANTDEELERYFG